VEDTKVSIILQAARKRFAHYGLGKTAMHEIAADIGMSKAALYYYCADKERIFIAVVEQDLAEFSTAIELLINRPSKASFKLKKYVHLRNELLVRMLNLAKVESVAAADVFNPVYDGLRRNFYETELSLVRKIITYGIAQQEFQKVPVDTYADLFVSTLAGLRTIAFAANESRASHEEKTAQQSTLFAEIFLKSLHTQPVPGSTI